MRLFLIVNEREIFVCICACACVENIENLRIVLCLPGAGPRDILKIGPILDCAAFWSRYIHCILEFINTGIAKFDFYRVFCSKMTCNNLIGSF